MRYKTLEEVAGRYGLTVDLDEKAQLAEWESRLKKLLEAKQKELPTAKNPSLRHKIERECAEVQEACKFVSQQNLFTKLRRCVDEDKQEIFEHELRKPETRAVLPAEDDAQYEQFLELKVAARKKWSNGTLPPAAATASPIPLSWSEQVLEQTAPAVSNSLLIPAAAPTISEIEPGHRSGAGMPVNRSAELSSAENIRPSEGLALAPAAVSKPEPATMGGRSSAVSSNFGTSGPAPLPSEQTPVEEVLPSVVDSALPSATLATTTASSIENVTQQAATTGSRTTASAPSATGQLAEENRTETTTSDSNIRRLPKISIKREHVRSAFDILLKLCALMGLGGSFRTLKIIGTALAVLLIAFAGLITELTRERSRQNRNLDTTANVPARQESQVTTAGPPPPEPSMQSTPSDGVKPFSEAANAPIENAKHASESANLTKEAASPPIEPVQQSSEVAKQSSEIVKQPSDVAKQTSETGTRPAEVVKQSSEPAKQPAEPVKPAEVAKQSAESIESPRQPSELAKQTSEPAKESNGVADQSRELAKQSPEPLKKSSEAPTPLSEVPKQISEVAKAPVGALTPLVLIAKPQESPHPEPAAEIKSAPPPKPKVQLALLRIESTPSDATITIRGTKQPLRTPAEFNLLPGDYDVALALDCYTAVSTTLHLDGGENRVLKRDLQSLQPALTVRTLPPGAKIYVDGAPRNQLTPATIAGIEPGDRWVTVELPGYRSQNMAVKAKCGEIVPVDFGILQRATARVNITSNARGASIWVDGADSGQTTPCSMELPLGTHRLRLVGPRGYRPEEKSFYLQNEESVRLDVPLTPELVAIPAYNPNPARPEPPQEYIPRANPNLLVWCGLDYSMVRMIGTARDFPESEMFPNVADRRGDRAESMTSAWNELFMKEMYPRLSRDLGAIVQADLRAIESRNSRVSPQQIFDDDSSPRYARNLADIGTIFNPTRFLHRGNKNLPSDINEADIAAAIRSYRLQTRTGLGLVFIMDRLVKREETSCMYVVFFDIASRSILSQERVCADAGGGGIRNHWFGSIKETVKHLPEMYHDARLKR
jgi:hypothetical protein